MTNDEIKIKAINAQAILNNDVFNEIIDELKEDYIRKWENSKELDTNTREMFYNRVKAIQEVKRELIRLLNAKLILDKG